MSDEEQPELLMDLDPDTMDIDKFGPARLEPIREVTTKQLWTLTLLARGLNYNRVLSDEWYERLLPKGIHILNPELEHHFAHEQPVEAHWRCKAYLAFRDTEEPQKTFVDIPKPEFDRLPRGRPHLGWVRGSFGMSLRMSAKDGKIVEEIRPVDHDAKLDISSLLDEGRDGGKIAAKRWMDEFEGETASVWDLSEPGDAWSEEGLR